ncbi:MAG: DUF2027 domain-containing protein [Bacteroidales bacterium]|nr:DUF2027 domain-containing protein [Bacteroidales bacterium]
MKFKTGDKVKFLNDSGGGVVSEIINENQVLILTGDGFEIPVAVRDLIKSGNNADYEIENIHYNKEPVKREIEKKNKPAGIESLLPFDVPKNAPKNIALGFVPSDQNNAGISDINLYLVNDSPYALSFFIGIQENVSWKYTKSGYLEADTKILLVSFSQSDVSKIKNMHFQAVFLARGKYFPQPPADTIVSLSEVRFYKENTFKENDFFDEKALIIPVSGNDKVKLDQESAERLAQAMTEKNDTTVEKTNQQERQNDILEIDLHIEKIFENHDGMSAGEIITMQMNRFYTALEEAMINKVQKIVFIHGIGNGKLKYELLKALDEKYPDLKYQDASFKEYGYGATMVYLS